MADQFQPLAQKASLGSSPRNHWQVNDTKCSLVSLIRPAQPPTFNAVPQQCQSIRQSQAGWVL